MKEPFKLSPIATRTRVPSQARQKSQQKQSKSINSKYMESPWSFTIKNKKRAELEKIRQMEIQLENKALTSRINERSQKKKRNNQYSDRQDIFLMKPLHEGKRRQHLRQVKQENISQRKRIESLKGTIDLTEMEKQWQTKQRFRRFASKHDKQSKLKKPWHSIDLTLNEENQHSSSRDCQVKYHKQRVISGKSIQLKIQEYRHVMIISGVLKGDKICVVMVVKKQSLQRVLTEQCESKIQIFGNSLQFDPQINSLYFLTKDRALQGQFLSDTCSQFDLTTIRKAISNQHKLLNRTLKPQHPGQTITNEVQDLNKGKEYKS